MLVKVDGDNHAARAVAAVLEHEGYVLEGFFPKYRFIVDEAFGTKAIELDSVDCKFEQLFLKHVRQLYPRVIIQDAGGNQRDDTMHITVPSGDDEARKAIALAALRSLDDSSKRRWRLWPLVALLLTLLPSLAGAQTSEVTVVQGGKTATVSAAGNFAVECKVGCVAGGGVTAISATGTLSSTSCPGTGCVTLTLTGQGGVGFRFTDSSFVGSLAAELSMDGGATWTETDLYLTLSGTAYNRLARLTSPGLSANFVIVVAPGTTDVRLRVNSYTSGSAAITLSATMLQFVPPSSVGAQDSNVQGIGLVGGRYASISGTMMPAVLTDSAAATNGMGLIVRDPQLAVATGGAANALGAQIMVKDNTTGSMGTVSSLTTAPVGTEPALLVRNIPSGTQPMSATALPLPTGAATAGLQTTGNVSLASIDAKLTNPLPVSMASLPLATDAATATLQTAILASVKHVGPTSTAAMVMATDQSVTLLSSDTTRVELQLCNQSRSPMFVKFGATATSFSYNKRVAAGECYTNSSYTGQVDAVWDIGADKFAMVSQTK